MEHTDGNREIRRRSERAGNSEPLPGPYPHPDSAKIFFCFNKIDGTFRRKILMAKDFAAESS
jgi:hypothetical protein